MIPVYVTFWKHIGIDKPTILHSIATDRGYIKDTVLIHKCVRVYTKMCKSIYKIFNHLPPDFFVNFRGITQDGHLSSTDY